MNRLNEVDLNESKADLIIKELAIDDYFEDFHDFIQFFFMEMNYIEN